jgi:hypothetical protein
MIRTADIWVKHLISILSFLLASPNFFSSYDRLVSDSALFEFGPDISRVSSAYCPHCIIITHLATDKYHSGAVEHQPPPFLFSVQSLNRSATILRLAYNL